MNRLAFFSPLVVALASAQGQWTIQESHTTADLRGVHSLGNGIVWASGTSGTVLRTIDGGRNWLPCAIPNEAEKLDFRGIQAFDANTAIVMSSGPGDKSRLYKTTDGCKSWKLLFTNPDEEGFWDGLIIGNGHSEGLLIGDQVKGKFAVFSSLYLNSGRWETFEHTVSSPKSRLPAPHSKDEVIFAASNSILSGNPGGGLTFVTGGASGAFLYATKWHRMLFPDSWKSSFVSVPLPLAKGSSAGAFSFGIREGCTDNYTCAVVVVGGDYKKPDETGGTAAFGLVNDKSEVPRSFTPSAKPPNGYRSSVAYDVTAKRWITVGPNGTDISTDDGRNWHPLTPTALEGHDADKNWNALSLPFVVGPKGRIGKLER